MLQAKLPDIFFGFLIQLCVCFAGKYICFDATGVADIPPSCIVAEKSYRGPETEVHNLEWPYLHVLGR